MKTFILALILFAPDGTRTEVPVETMKFASQADCAKSQALMNKGVAASKSYACIEYIPSKVSALKSPAKAIPASVTRP